MKTFTNQMAGSLRIALLSSIGLVATHNVLGLVEIKGELWQFNSGNSPVASEFVSNTTSHCVATVTPGQFGSGWLAVDNGALGGATGVWELGRNGVIACSGLSDLIGSSGTERSITIKVKQLHDMMYSDLATVLVPGASLQSTKIITNEPSSFGVWVTEETQWQVNAATAVDQATIVGAYYGSAVDQVVMETVLSTVLPPPTLAIRQVGNQIEISWPATASDMVLEATGNLQNPESWAPVEAQVQTSGGVSFVLLTPLTGEEFYRLKQP